MVTMRRTHWRGALPRAVLLAVTAALVPLPAVAGEANAATGLKPSQAEKSIQAAIPHAVARAVAAMPARAVPARRAEQAGSSTGSVAFFKTGPGIAALAVMAVGVGYAIYSTQHDRITSPAKE